MTQPLLAVNDLEVRYGEVLALNGVSFNLGAGSALAVLGTNGAGKSTLGRVLSGLIPASSGTVSFDGDDLTKMSAAEVRQRGLCYVPEGRGIFPGLSVEDNLRMAVRWAARAQRRSALDNAFDMFAILADRRNQRASSLSGGEQQMLALARALAVRPRLLIADEMSLGLAPKVVNVVFETLAKVKADGVSVLLIEQFVHRALDFADEAMILQRGTVGWAGPSRGASQQVIDGYLGQSV